MRLLVLSGDEVHKHLTARDCRDLMREALLALAGGEVFLPLRTVVRPPGLAGLLALMSTHVDGERPSFGMKSVCVFHGNPERGKDAHQGVVTLFDHETGEPLAIMNAAAITEVRTAAVSALATEALARRDANVLTIFGTGTQAKAHLRALADVRPFTEVRVVSRDPANARAFAETETSGVAVPITAFSDPEEAVAGADVIVTATTSHDPVLFRDWVAPGAHVNAVGSSIPVAAELDPHLIAAASLWCDRKESLVNESGDYLRAVEAGVVTEPDVRGELGEILAGTIAARTSDAEITVFKSLGLAVEDVVAARHLYEVAVRAGLGQWVEF
ncbi:ornithine cyclodeaminase family protein [Glycomyces luteolus]|uniref:Ornithine cyclodeaminase family protein n=1 Tax=Glycomyces luteolus TaxID=2670330 RepID=A0A9X3PFW8_9ACTN|nr:ornithine cyclodeaminase family protein [Glycomyces luteolus]MDA1361864.1 ornithine cyclodeaminase family protein [Glycomyces luteolus]